MADHLEFLKTVPGPVPNLGPVPPLDPIPPKRGAPDHVANTRNELHRRLELVGRERAAVVERLKHEHRQFIALEACRASLVDALTDLERHRLEQQAESPDAAA